MSAKSGGIARHQRHASAFDPMCINLRKVGTAKSTTTVKAIWIMTTVMGRCVPRNTSLLKIIMPALAAMKLIMAINACIEATIDVPRKRRPFAEPGTREMFGLLHRKLH